MTKSYTKEAIQRRKSLMKEAKKCLDEGFITQGQFDLISQKTLSFLTFLVNRNEFPLFV